MKSSVFDWIEKKIDSKCLSCLSFGMAPVSVLNCFIIFGIQFFEKLKLRSFAGLTQKSLDVVFKSNRILNPKLVRPERETNKFHFTKTDIFDCSF